MGHSPFKLGQIFLFFLTFFFRLAACPIGNPTAPSLIQEGFFIPDTTWASLQLGFGGDLLFSKGFSSCRHSKTATYNGSLSGASEIGGLIWNIYERFNLEIDLGSGSYSWGWNQQGGAVRGNAQGGLLWSAQGKLILLEILDTSFSIFGIYGGWNWMEGPATFEGRAERGHGVLTMRYWQTGAAFSQKIALFCPYLGIAVNESNLHIKHLESGGVRLHEKHRFGFFGGCSLTKGSQLLVNLEWRSFFEQGVALSGQIRF